MFLRLRSTCLGLDQERWTLSDTSTTPQLTTNPTSRSVVVYEDHTVASNVHNEDFKKYIIYLSHKSRFSFLYNGLKINGRRNLGLGTTGWRFVSCPTLWLLIFYPHPPHSLPTDCVDVYLMDQEREQVVDSEGWAWLFHHLPCCRHNQTSYLCSRSIRTLEKRI